MGGWFFATRVIQEKMETNKHQALKWIRFKSPPSPQDSQFPQQLSFLLPTLVSQCWILEAKFGNTGFATVQLAFSRALGLKPRTPYPASTPLFELFIISLSLEDSLTELVSSPLNLCLLQPHSLHFISSTGQSVLDTQNVLFME